MKTYKTSIIKDTLNRTSISLRLLLRDKGTVIVFLLSVISFFFVCNSLNQAATEQSKIPVGLVNLDVKAEAGVEVATESSLSLIESLQTVEAFTILEEDMDTLERMLSNREIYCFYIINKGYEEKIKSGDLTHLITVYQVKGDQSVPILSDIFAGEMMYQICLERTASRFGAILKDKSQTVKESFYQYAKELRENDEFEFQFDITLADTTNGQEMFQNLDTSLLYRQVIAGLFAILLSFVIMFSYTYVCMEREQGIEKRVKLTMVARGTKELGTMLSVLILSLILSVVFVSCVCYYVNLPQAFGKLLLLSITFSFVISLLFLLITKIVRSFIAYQLLGAIMVLVLGASGFLSFIGMVLKADFLNVLKFTPNGWFIEKFVDIIINI
nr:ABC transporter permease [uncultured Lachnoclostridium sp.]